MILDLSVSSWLDESINVKTEFYAANDILPENKKLGDIKSLNPLINTKAVRNLGLWPKVTIDGNMDSQVLINDISNNIYSGSTINCDSNITGLGETSGIDGLKLIKSLGLPDSRLLLESFIAKPVNKAEDYAIAIEGYISPKESGEYQFHQL